MDIVVHALSNLAISGRVVLGPSRSMPCVLGRGGRRVRKREGDGATPIGVWIPERVLYRRDRRLPPPTRLPIRAIRPNDGWCDAVGDRNYNRAIRHPYAASAERLWREDALYDVVVVLSHNRRPRIQGHGSAVFIHIGPPMARPTAGCIGLSKRDLDLVVGVLTRQSRVSISGA